MIERTNTHVLCTAVRTLAVRVVCSLVALVWPVYQRHVSRTQMYDVTENAHLSHNKMQHPTACLSVMSPPPPPHVKFKQTLLQSL